MTAISEPSIIPYTESLNLLAFIDENAQSLQSFCYRPLKKIGIVYFGHIREYHSGAGAAIVTDPDVPKCWIGLGLILPMFLTSGFYLGASITDKIFSHQKLKEMEQTLSIANTLFYVDQYPKHTDVYVFAGQANNSSIVSNYLNYSRYLEKFILFYKQQFNMQIKLLPEVKIFRPDIAISTTQNTSIIENIVNFPLAKLTTRELDVMKAMAFCKNLKESANILNISYKTLESHVNKIKQQLNVHSQFECIDIFLEHYLQYPNTSKFHG